MPRSRPLLVVLLALALLLAAACGGAKDGPEAPKAPSSGAKGGESHAAQGLGFPAFATKNTTRVGGGDATADAAAIAQAVYPDPARHPQAVVLVDAGDWQAALAATSLFAAPLGAPVLFTDGDDIPKATQATLDALAPTGAKDVANAQVIRIATQAKPGALKTTDVTGKDPADVAARIDALDAAASGATSDRVVLVSSEHPELAVPAAGWAAKSGDPILFAGKDELPAATVAALKRHAQPKIYVLGDTSVIGAKVEQQLRRLGTVKRIGTGTDPVVNAIDFARYVDGTFGWGVVDPGHGLVFVSNDRPLDAIAAAPLSGSGTYGPILLHTGATKLDKPLESYLLDIQPGYRRDPVRAVYNHGWVIGDEDAMSEAVQARIDALLEITQVQSNPGSS